MGVYARNSARLGNFIANTLPKESLQGDDVRIGQKDARIVSRGSQDYPIWYFIPFLSRKDFEILTWSKKGGRSEKCIGSNGEFNESYYNYESLNIFCNHILPARNNIMKRFLLTLIMAFSIAYAGSAYAQQNNDVISAASPPRILIAYFSMSGNTRLIAHDIQKMTGGDLFEIKTVREYGPDFDSAVEQAREELRSSARPELQAKVTNMQTYDVVFVGFPNWVGTMPMAVFSFLEQHDFTGKTLVPFCTHGTSGISNTISDLKKLNLHAEIREHIAFYRNDVKNAEESVRNWLRELGYLK